MRDPEKTKDMLTVGELKEILNNWSDDSSVKYRKILFYIFFEVHRTHYCSFSHSLKFG